MLGQLLCTKLWNFDETVTNFFLGTWSKLYVCVLLKVHESGSHQSPNDSFSPNSTSQDIDAQIFLAPKTSFTNNNHSTHEIPASITTPFLGRKVTCRVGHQIMGIFLSLRNYWVPITLHGVKTHASNIAEKFGSVFLDCKAGCFVSGHLFFLQMYYFKVVYNWLATYKTFFNEKQPKSWQN